MAATKNNKVPFTYEDASNPDVKEKVYFVQGKRVRVRPEVEVEVNPIIRDIEKESRALKKSASKADDKFVVIEQ